jgi:putative copper export protein/mono/diheme cytochrome c family protein
MTWSDFALAAARGLHLAATMSLTGALIFRLLVAPFALVRVVRPSLAVAWLAGLVWLVLQSAELSDASNLAETFAAVPIAALHTRFGHVLLLRLAVLPVAVVVAGSGAGRTRLAVAALLGAVAVTLEAALGHVAASGQPLLVASLFLHLLAASIWLGGLIPLWLALDGAHPGVTARRFSLVAVIAVAILAATALQQATALIGGLPGMVGTDYGHAASVKLFLLVFLLTLAVINRFVLTPALEAAPTAMRRLRASVVVETVLGLCVVMAAAQLASLPPGVHLQPDWPFAWRLSFDATADPDLGNEVKGALAALAGAVLLLALGIAVRRLGRLRWLAIAAAAVITVLALPHLSLLLVPAYPTSFYTSLTDFDGDGIARGAQLFAKNCVACHGADGRGDGPLANSLDIPPADLTAEHLWAHSDGEMFWYLTHGMDSPRGGLSMPGFGKVLGSEARWVLIDYVRALNAGVAINERGAWNHPIPAPELEARCADGRVIALEDLRGRVVRIVVGPPAPPVAGLATIFIDPAEPRDGACVAGAPEVRLAYAIVAGLTPETLAGTVFLVDPAAWLRNRIRPSDPQPNLEALVKTIIANPLAVPSAIGHHH